MAAGNAILARDTESNREVLGEAGLYWETPQQLAEMLKRVWVDEAKPQRLQEAKRARPAERYNWEKVTSWYLELCEASPSKQNRIRRHPPELTLP